MEFRCIPDELTAALGHWTGDTLAVGLFAPSDDHPAHVLRSQLIAAFGDDLQQRLEQRRFKAKPGECLSLERLGTLPRTLILVGLGEPAEFDLDTLRAAAAAAGRAATAAAAQELALALPCEGLASATAGRAMAEAVRLSVYSDQRFKSEREPQPQPAVVSLIGLPASSAESVAAVDGTCAGVELARQLVAAPPNVATPQHLADTAAAIARDHGLELRVLEREDCQALGMGAYLGVAQGSELPP
jgi:leucyl aminopeptidase